MADKYVTFDSASQQKRIVIDLGEMQTVHVSGHDAPEAIASLLHAVFQTIVAVNRGQGTMDNSAASIRESASCLASYANSLDALNRGDRKSEAASSGCPAMDSAIDEKCVHISVRPGSSLAFTSISVRGLDEADAIASMLEAIIYVLAQHCTASGAANRLPYAIRETAKSLASHADKLDASEPHSLPN